MAEAIFPLIVDYGLIEVYDNDGLVAADDLRSRWDLRSDHRLYISPLAVKLEGIIAPPPATRAIFGNIADGDWPEVLVLMPFSPDLQPVFEDHIRKVVVDTCGFSCARADQFMSPNAIIHDIWSALNRARLVIADCTDMNPNVFYEIGVAHTLGKRPS